MDNRPELRFLSCFFYIKFVIFNLSKNIPHRWRFFRFLRTAALNLCFITVSRGSRWVSCERLAVVEPTERRKEVEKEESSNASCRFAANRDGQTRYGALDVRSVMLLSTCLSFRSASLVYHVRREDPPQVYLNVTFLERCALNRITYGVTPTVLGNQ